MKTKTCKKCGAEIRKKTIRCHNCNNATMPLTKKQVRQLALAILCSPFYEEAIEGYAIDIARNLLNGALFIKHEKHGTVFHLMDNDLKIYRPGSWVNELIEIEKRAHDMAFAPIDEGETDNE